MCCSRHIRMKTHPRVHRYCLDVPGDLKMLCYLPQTMSIQLHRQGDQADQRASCVWGHTTLDEGMSCFVRPFSNLRKMETASAMLQQGKLLKRAPACDKAFKLKPALRSFGKKTQRDWVMVWARVGFFVNQVHPLSAHQTTTICHCSGLSKC